MSQQGFSLPEILITLLLSSGIMMGLMSHYLEIKRYYHQLQHAIEEGIELDVITDLIRNSIRRAGFTPCLGLDHLSTWDSRHGGGPLMAIQLESSGIHMNRMSDSFEQVSDITDAGALLLNNPLSVHAKDDILIADCYHAEVQRMLHSDILPDHQTLILRDPLMFVYHDPIYVGRWVEEYYFIRNTADGHSSLYYRAQFTEALSDSVHHLRVHEEQESQGRLLQVTLDLTPSESIILDTRMRNR